MELSGPKKVFLIFLETELSYISGDWPFQAQKYLRKTPQKKLLIFLEMELSGSNIKKFLMFSQKKPFLIFQEIETPRKFFIF